VQAAPSCYEQDKLVESYSLRLYTQGPVPPGGGRLEYLIVALRVVRDDVKGTQCPGV
jgi:hypothetical protein